MFSNNIAIFDLKMSQSLVMVYKTFKTIHQTFLQAKTRETKAPLAYEVFKKTS